MLPPVPFIDLKPQYKDLEARINARIKTVLEHGQFILGPEVMECEKALADYIGAKYCLTAASGTDALMMALMALEIGPGDEVITTPFSFFATAEVISLVGATPVFADIQGDTFNLDPDAVAKAMTPKTKAIMPVSLYGQPADFEEIGAIGARHGIPVIEDAAQSFGANYRGKKSSNLGMVGATSFFPAKPLGCYGDGGAVFTNDAGLYKRMEQIRVHGQDGRYNHVVMGINGRLDTIQCAVLLEKLTRYDWEIERRDRIARRYSEAFADLDHASELEGASLVPIVKSDRSSVWAQYTIRVKNRERFAASLKEKGIPTSVHYPSPLHHQPVYAHLRERYHLPVAEKAAREVISLPRFPDMTDEQMERVVRAVREYF